MTKNNLTSPLTLTPEQEDHLNKIWNPAEPILLISRPGDLLEFASLRDITQEQIDYAYRGLFLLRGNNPNYFGGLAGYLQQVLRVVRLRFLLMGCIYPYPHEVVGTPIYFLGEQTEGNGLRFTDILDPIKQLELIERSKEILLSRTSEVKLNNDT